MICFFFFVFFCLQPIGKLLLMEMRGTCKHRQQSHCGTTLINNSTPLPRFPLKVKKQTNQISTTCVGIFYFNFFVFFCLFFKKKRLIIIHVWRWEKIYKAFDESLILFIRHVEKLSFFLLLLFCFYSSLSR